MFKKIGFTLLELLVVLIIIGILVSIALPQYTRIVVRTQAAEALTQLKVIVDAEQAYKMKNGAYVPAGAGNALHWERLGLDMPNVNATMPLSNRRFVYRVNVDLEAVAQRKDGHPTYENALIKMDLDDYSIIEADSDHPY